MKKTTLLVMVITFLSYYCKAQASLLAFGVQDEPETNTPLFRLNDEQYNHHFNYVLPNDGILNIDFLRLSDWGSKNELAEILQIAAAQAAMLKDSFASATSTKTIELNIPINKETLSINYKEDNSKKNQLAFKDNTYYQLKSGFDTIRIVRNMGVRTKPVVDSGVIQIQYTFILKDLQDIQQLAASPVLAEDIGAKTDAYILRQRQKWSRQDASQHQLSLNYDPAKSDSIRKKGSNLGFLGKNIGLYLGVGAIVYQNSISPYLDETFAYLVPTRGKSQGFVGLNITVFGLIAGSSTFFTNRNYASINAEFGFCKKTGGLMQQKSSIALGLMMNNENGVRNNMFHMGFTFGFNSFLSAGFNTASDFRKNSKNNFWGVNFKFNL